MGEQVATLFTCPMAFPLMGIKRHSSTVLPAHQTEAPLRVEGGSNPKQLPAVLAKDWRRFEKNPDAQGRANLGLPFGQAGASICAPSR